VAIAIFSVIPTKPVPAKAGSGNLLFPPIYGGRTLDIHNLADLIANQRFPIALSILLIFWIDRFMQEIVVAQKEGYRIERILWN
jgi:hypothetical protein